MTGPRPCPSYCPTTDLPCQGPAGHPGDHWAYSAGGWYCYWVRPKGRKGRGGVAAGQVPPGHPAWPAPAGRGSPGHPLLDRARRDAGRERARVLGDGDGGGGPE